MDELYDDPVEGRLWLTRSCASETGYKFICVKKSGKDVKYYN